MQEHFEVVFLECLIHDALCGSDAQRGWEWPFTDTEGQVSLRFIGQGRADVGSRVSPSRVEGDLMPQSVEIGFECLKSMPTGAHGLPSGSGVEKTNGRSKSGGDSHPRGLQVPGKISASWKRRRVSGNDVFHGNPWGIGRREKVSRRLDRFR